jgi:hypothetical protein
MGKEDEYRQHAAEAFELAKRATDQTDRIRLLVVAEGWLDLADRCVKPQKPSSPSAKP